MNLVVDLGQSGTRIKYGEEIKNLQIAKKPTQNLVDTVEEILKSVPKNSYENIYLSLTGLQGKVGNPEAFGKICNKYFGTKNVCVMDDGIASYVGALNDLSGVVLTIGGGVVAVSYCDGKFGHGDGKGLIFGDFGGGFWVGQMGMQKAVATIDGRENCVGLVKALDNEIKEFQSLRDNTGYEAMKLCIAAAKTVVSAAEKNDSDALDVLQNGAKLLAKTIITAWNKVKNSNEKPVISIQGGLAKSNLYVNLIQEELKSNLDFEYKSAAGDHLIGAPIVGDKYPDGVTDLLKWWRA